MTIVFDGQKHIMLENAIDLIDDGGEGYKSIVANRKKIRCRNRGLIHCSHSPVSHVLFTLHSGVNVFYEDQAGLESNAAQHQEKCKRDDCHVPKVKRSLQHSTHLTAMKEIVK